MSKAIGIFNGNFKGGNRKLDQSDLTSPRDALLSALKQAMGEEAYRKFFNKVYSRYRWSDTDRYERILRYMLTRCERRTLRQAIAEGKDLVDSLDLLDVPDLARYNLAMAAACSEDFGEIEFNLEAADRIQPDGKIRRGLAGAPAVMGEAERVSKLIADTWDDIPEIEF